MVTGMMPLCVGGILREISLLQCYADVHSSQCKVKMTMNHLILRNYWLKPQTKVTYTLTEKSCFGSSIFWWKRYPAGSSLGIFK